MKNLKLALSVTMATLALTSSQVMADWENLPSAGVSVGSDTSPYILCNPTGNFGSGWGPSADVQPTSISDPCAVLPASDALPPDSDFVGINRIPVINATRSIVMNNGYTNNTNVVIGSLKEYVWRNSVSDICIYGIRVLLTYSDYNLTAPGNQFFEVNDMARRGWSGKTIDVAYSTVPTTAFSTYRIGRTFTSVKHGPDSSYINQPLIGLGSSPAITATQKSDLNEDWVDFTTLVGPSAAVLSGMQYIRTNCSSGSFSTEVDAIRLRQTSRIGQPAIEVQVEGVIPN